MEELEKTAKELILAITEKTLKTLKDKGLLKKPSKLQMLCTSPEMTSLIKKLSAPKYDSCRKFKKGDIVRLREYNGRKPYDYWHKQTIKHFGAKLDTVLEDELDSGNVDIFQDAPIDELTVRVNSCHLELVTPVEELGPFDIYKSDDNEYVITFEDSPVSIFPFKGDGYPYYYTQEQAKARAEQERDRLNAEYRKELEK
jgi:hypothetical protein